MARHGATSRGRRIGLMISVVACALLAPVAASPARAPTATPTPTASLSQPPAAFDRSVASVATGYGHACALLNDGTVHCWGRNSEGELGIGTNDNRGDAPGELPTPAVPL